MTKTGSRRAIRLLLALCVALVVSAGPASAAVGLPSLPAPVEGVVGAPVGKVKETVERATEGVVPPAKEPTETVEAAPAAIPPVAEATETVTAPVKEVTETATKTTEEVTHAVTQAPAVPAAPVVPSVEASAITMPKSVSKGSASGVSGSSAGSGSSARVSPSGSSAPEVESTPTTAAPAPAASADSPGETDDGDEAPAVQPPEEDHRSAVPTEGGAVRAPVPKWVAYVWPAIALTWRHPAATLPAYARQVGAGASSSAAAAGTAGSDAPAQGVKGVHASGGLPSDRAGQSSSPFAKIPAAVGGFTSGVPGEAIAYLILVALIVAAVFVAVKVELGRRGSGAGPSH
jgi:hypothetical protein